MGRLAMTTHTNSEDMIDYDIALGGKKADNSTYLKDYWSTGLGKPALDSSQDFNLTSAEESGGVTTLEFSRLAVTGDKAKDVQIENDTKIYMAWAIGPQDATDSTTFAKHADKAGGGRGHMKIAYNMLTGQEIPTPTTANTGYAQQATVAMVFITILQLAFIVMLH